MAHEVAADRSVTENHDAPIRHFQVFSQHLQQPSWTKAREQNIGKRSKTLGGRVGGNRFSAYSVQKGTVFSCFGGLDFIFNPFTPDSANSKIDKFSKITNWVKTNSTKVK